jgi:hypothetical protein
MWQDGKRVHGTLVRAGFPPSILLSTILQRSHRCPWCRALSPNISTSLGLGTGPIAEVSAVAGIVSG